MCAQIAGWTALMIAAGAGHLLAAQVLLEKGANVFSKAKV